MTISKNNEFSSFRDSSGYVFWSEGDIYRTVSKSYQEHYDSLISSGLSKELTDKKLLIEFHETASPSDFSGDSDIYKLLKPKKVPFISYPYEWSFSQFKDASLCTLEIQKAALLKGMTLKDASAFNIQFAEGKPLLIDILSFEKYVEGSPWHAYGQFCRHFIAPLLLASFIDPRLLILTKDYLDGIPLDLVSNMLPVRAKANMLYLMHIALQSKAKTYVTNKNYNEVSVKISRNQSLALIESLISGIKSLKPHSLLTTWGDYYNATNYSDTAMAEKTKIVEEWTKEIKPHTIWDLGGNNCKFCRDINYTEGEFVCMDFDIAAVEDGYNKVKLNKEKNILPLVVDLTNPSSGIGWNNRERNSIQSRGPADMSYALALIHHLAIGNNLPLEYVRDYLSEITNYLIIEFIPKDDSMVEILLKLKTAPFNDYNIENFENVFTEKFEIIKKTPIKESKRFLYLMKKIS